MNYIADGTRSEDGTRTYMVDAIGRVVRIDDKNSSQFLELAYDALGRPYLLEDAAGVRELHYFGDELVQEELNGNLDRQYSNHPLLGRCYTHVTGESFLHLYDARQNEIATLDSSGALRTNYRYTDFGAPSVYSVGAPTGLEPMFGGMRYLDIPGTNSGAPVVGWPQGLYLGMFRLYDPFNGVWLSSDPLGYVDGPNRSAYVAQNPIDFIDPLGLSKRDKSDTTSFASAFLSATGGASLFRDDPEPIDPNTSSRGFNSVSRNPFAGVIDALSDAATSVRDVMRLANEVVVNPGAATAKIISGGINYANATIPLVALQGGFGAEAQVSTAQAVWDTSQSRLISAAQSELSLLRQDPDALFFQMSYGLGYATTSALVGKSVSLIPPMARFAATIKLVTLESKAGFMGNLGLDFTRGVPVTLKTKGFVSVESLELGRARWLTMAPDILAGERFARQGLQITPEFQKMLGPWTNVPLAPNSRFTFGLAALQEGQPLGTWIQLYNPKGFPLTK